MPSSVVANMVYDEPSKKLRVVFVSGAVYEYLKVPPAAYNEMKSAASKGEYLNKHIKGFYAYKKLK
jgi:hypothetical protein